MSLLDRVTAAWVKILEKRIKDMGNSDNEDASDAENDDELMDQSSPTGEKFNHQKTVWTLSKLPYATDLEEQADEHFSIIKCGFAHSVLLHDIRKGTLHYCTELERYISLHSYRFSKEDHIALLKLLVAFIKKGQIYRDVRVIIRTMHSLLRKKDCLTRNDITFDWRPFYELYHEVAYGNLEEDGVFLMPEGFKDDLTKLIRCAREFWPLQATQEILDEFRPLLCPWDESMVKGMKLMQMFTPTCMTSEEHSQYGAGLWFDEMWQLVQTIQNNSLIEPYIVHMTTRLSRDCPGFIDWSGRLNYMYTKIMRSLKLGRGSGLNQPFPMHSSATWVIYMLGVERDAQMYLNRLLVLVESYLHPSNHGSHSGSILALLYRLVSEMINRVRRERTGRPQPLIPDRYKLKSEDIESFVRSFLPCLRLAIFTKVKQEFVSYIVKGLALLSPHTVIPAILEVVYPSLETVTEPHRLTQSLTCLFVALIPMLREEPLPGERSRKAEIVFLLESLLPAIDPNDIKKTLLCFQVFGVLVNTVPLVDCSEAVHLREDLSEDEKEICSATANFEGIVAGCMDKILMLLDWGSNGASCGHGSLSKNTHKYNMEEHVLHDGVRMLYKGIMMNSSLPISQLAADRLFQYVRESLYDSHVVASTVSEMVSITVRARPELIFHRFLSLISKKLQEVINNDTYSEEKVDFSITWWLSLACGLFRAPASIILQHKDEVASLVRLFLPIKCQNGINFACKALQRLLRSLTVVFMDVDREWLKQLDEPLDKFLPIRSWAAPLDRRAFSVNERWFVPTDESIAFAKELLDEHLTRCLTEIQQPGTLSKHELYRDVLVTLTCIQGASFSLPMFNTPIVKTNTMPTFIEVNTIVTRPVKTPELTVPTGGTIRGIVLQSMEALLQFLLTERESEVKTISAVLSVLSSLVFSKGSDRTKLQSMISTHRLARIMMGDKLNGASAYVKALAEESINVAHQARIQLSGTYHLTEEHIKVIQLLVRISMSSYAENRRAAQSVLSRILREFPYSFTLVVDDILNALNPDNNTPHSQLKGALYMLVDGRRVSLLLRQNWEVSSRTWPALIRMCHSERPSIIRLLETAQTTIVDSYESYRIEELIPSPAIEQLALDLLNCGAGGKQASKYGVPDEEAVRKAEEYIREHNEVNQRSYTQLVCQLLNCAADSSLHWRHTDLAQVLLSMLIRRDAPTHIDCIRLFLRLLVHDTLKTRKMAIAFLGAWLKINKPLAVKKPYIPDFTEENRGPGAKYPIRFGMTRDNRCMQFEEDKLPSNALEWNSFPFCAKMHWGFYTWPKELITYARVEEQHAINRSYGELNEAERLIVDAMKDPSFSTRFRDLLSIEEKKGDEKFNVVNFSLFHGLFRSYNDTLIDVFKGHLESLVEKETEGATRLATEIVAGIINGSKMWQFEKVESLWKWMAPFLQKVLSNLKDNAQKNWGTCIAAICGSNESRMLQPLLHLLFDLALRPTDNCFMTAARLFLLQSALCQFEWRSLQLWTRISPHLLQLISQPYHNIRERVGSSLVTLTWFDLPSLFIDPSLPSELTPFKLDVVFDAFDQMLGDVWEEAVRCGDNVEGGPPSTSASSASLSSVNGSSALNGDTDPKRSSRLALKTLVQFVFNYGLQTLGPVSLRCLAYAPLIAHFSFETSDDELRNACVNVTREFVNTMLIPEDKSLSVVEQFEKFFNGRYSWRTRVILLSTFSSIVFSNTFAFDVHKERVARVVAVQMADERIEVREAAASAISLFVHSGYLPVTQEFIVQFEHAILSDNPSMKHSGVLGLCSIVQAFPYSVPTFLPDILAFLCRQGREREPIKDTVKKALAEFKRTHQDCWHEHKEAFTEDQLILLMDFLVSPNYYV